MHEMSSGNGKIPCLGELSRPATGDRIRLAGDQPACDFAEAKVWEALGGGWQCLYGCYCQCGVSIEWHDFECSKPCDWSRSFHPNSLELCLNVSGHARMECGKDTLLFGPKTVGLYSAEPKQLAAWRLPGEHHQFLTVEFSRGYLDSYLQSHAGSVHPLLRRVLNNQPRGCRISKLGRLTLPQLRHIEALRQPQVSGVARGLWYQGQAMTLMAEHLFLGEDKPEKCRQSLLARRRVERTVELLSQNMTEPLPLAQLGREVGCSPHYLSRTFSREMGMTIQQYLRQIRMERAAELLKSGQCNVTEAALEVGYSSLSHFSHAFCEIIGCCPGLYPLGLVGSRRAVSTARIG